MRSIDFQINGGEEDIRKVWVHLQDVGYNEGSNYKVEVPELLLRLVFDPYNAKLETVDWPTFVNGEIKDFGNIAVERYFYSMAKINYEEDFSFRWVVASVDSITQTPNGLKLIGKVVPFKK